MSNSSLDRQNIETTSWRYGTISYLKNDILLGRSLREYGEWAQGELNLLLDLIDGGSTVVDVGAFVGTHTIAFARHVGPGGQVYAFEPHPVAFDLLRSNVEQNDLSNVKLFNAALSDYTGTINLRKTNLADTNNPGSFSLLTEVDVAAESSGVAIDVMTLDQFDIDSCHLMKVDVEGMELNVLKGSVKTLRRFRPLVFAECLSLHNGWQIVLFMKEKGFEAFLHNERSFNPDNFKKNANNFFGDARETNIVFVPANRLSAFQERCKHFQSLIPLKTLDDLALGMLKKPQYKYEALAPTSAAQILGVDFFANEPELRQLEASLQKKESQIHSLESQIHSLESQIDQIQHSIPMQLANRYQRVIEKLLRSGTRRRHYYELGLSGIRGILNEGWKTSFGKTKAYLLGEREALKKPSLVGMETHYYRQLIPADIRIIRNEGWRITRPLRLIGTLKRALTTRRVIKAIKHLSRGEFTYVKQGIRAALNSAYQKLPADMDLAYSMSFFRHDAVETPPLNEEVDIIIPIYNGMAQLVKLFDSLLRNTNSPYRLILVDDASTDIAVRPFLQNIAQQHANTVLIRNEENKGYVWSVNLASQYAQHHFVLLNTDVEVPKGWLQRLMGPILKDDNIASTTPFTNAGTICGFPYPNLDNEIFDNLKVDEVDAFFRYVDPESISIELPSAVGFCMGVNLNVWREIGSFDYGLFGRGYGEENDWSIRARMAGYRNVMVPNLFVYHKHGATFGQKDKQNLMQKNLSKLVRRHPSYLQLVDDFVRRDPAGPIRRFVLLLLSTHRAAAGNMLLIDHSIGGGANVYRQEIVEERLNRGQAILLLTCHPASGALELSSLYKEHKIAFSLSGLNDMLSLLKWVPCREIFYNNLVSFSQPLAILQTICRLKKESKSILTVALHDYFPLCPSYTLLDYKGHYCNLPSLQTCQVCLPRNPYADPSAGQDIRAWRNTWGEVIGMADNILCFSESSRALLTKVYPLKPERVTVQPHQLPIRFSKKPRLDLHAPLNIGVVGSIGYQKGSHIVIEMAKILEKRAPEAKVTVIGILNGAPRLKNLTITGPYERSELPDLIEKYKVNICLFPSICPETFSYVCSELIELGMPICCFDLGAQGERIARYDLGHIIHEISPEVAVQEVLQFFAKLKTKAT